MFTFQKTAMKMIPSTPDQIKRLEHLVEVARSLPMSKRVKRLQIVSLLCQGRRGEDIVGQCGAHKQQVSRIKAELKRNGLDTEIEKLERVIKKARPKEKKRRGPEGFKRWEEYVVSAGITVDKDPYYELATLIISPGASIAVIAVRDPYLKEKVEAEEMSEAERLKRNKPAPNKDIRNAIKAIRSVGSEDKCHWTNLSDFDRLAVEILGDLKKMSEIIKNHAEASERPEIRAVKERFGEECKFLVLHYGNAEACGELVEILFPDDQEYLSIPLQNEFTFFKHLEQIMFRLRMRWSCIGLFPCRWEIYNEMGSWAVDASHNDRSLSLDEIASRASAGTLKVKWYIFETREQEITRCMQILKVIQNYHALKGALFSLTPSLWKSLPFCDEYDFRTLTLWPKIRVDRKDLENCVVVIEPLPEVFYPPQIVPWKGEPEELATRFRCKDRPRFRYSVRAVPESQGETNVQPEAHDTGKVITKKMIRTVLVPRHSLYYDLRFPLDVISQLAKGRESGIYEEKVTYDNSDLSCIILCMPELLHGIHRAFKSNYYGDLHRSLLDAQLDFCQHNINTRIGRDVLFAGLYKQMSPSAGPYYFISESDYKRPSSIEVQARREHFLDAFRFKRQEGLEPFIYPNKPGKPDHYGIDASIFALLTDFDADFLAAGFSDEEWAGFDKTATQWAEAIGHIVEKKYWPNAKSSHEPDMRLVVAAMPADWRPSVNAFKNDIISLVNESFLAFRENRKRCIRAAIETAQQLALADLELAFIVIEEERAILSNWRSFLRKRIRGGLLEIVKRQKMEGSFDDEHATGGHNEDGALGRQGSGHVVDAESNNTKAKLLPDIQEDNQEEIEEICEFMEGLYLRGSLKEWSQDFALLAREASHGSWAAAAELLAGDYPSARAFLATAIPFCKRNVKKDGTIDKKTSIYLENLFSKLYAIKHPAPSRRVPLIDPF